MVQDTTTKNRQSNTEIAKILQNRDDQSKNETTVMKQCGNYYIDTPQTKMKPQYWNRYYKIEMFRVKAKPPWLYSADITTYIHRQTKMKPQYCYRYYKIEMIRVETKPPWSYSAEITTYIHPQTKMKPQCWYRYYKILMIRVETKPPWSYSAEITT